MLRFYYALYALIAFSHVVKNKYVTIPIIRIITVYVSNL